MKDWTKLISPYEGEEPYLYLAFAEEDSRKVWAILRPLLERGCRVWYCVGSSANADDFLDRQRRAAGAALTLLYLTDAACTDLDTKTNVLVNQEAGRPVLCLDPDGKDRRLFMGLREEIPHLSLSHLTGSAEVENAILHGVGFSQELIGDPVKIRESTVMQKTAWLFCALAAVMVILFMIGARNRREAPPPQDEISFSDPVLQTAVRQALGERPMTQEILSGITSLRFEEVPESWEEISELPSLERIEISQQALLQGGPLPDSDYVIILIGGGS
ncbi:MAG: hypothetical protein J6M46_02085 [Lachnospiraceae bacterium]|nr:hypothetical protein [Lachnospiraceae bacterium]